VAVQEKDTESLRRGESAAVVPLNLIGKIMSKLFKRMPFQPVEPDLVIGEELSLAEFGVDGKVIHTPGHTPGSVSVILDNGPAVVGDMIAARSSKTVDKASWSPFATDFNQMRQSLRRIIVQSPTVIYTSHGSSCTVEALKALDAKE
jgi:glyoxylase-like metal-dependent hydrolase (beta-lactamase superfamily II)